MQFSSQEPLRLLTCSSCSNTGSSAGKSCRVCKGMGVGREDQGNFYYFGRAMTKYAIALRHGRKKLNRIRLLTSFILFVLFMALFFWAAYRQRYLGDLDTIAFWTTPGTQIHFLFFAAFIPALYFWYRLIKKATPPHYIEYKRKKGGTLEDHPPVHDWALVHKMPHRKRRDIAKHMSQDTLLVLDRAFGIAAAQRAAEIRPIHIFRALVSVTEIKNIFVRLGINIQSLEGHLDQRSQGAQSQADPLLGADSLQVLFHAYLEARRVKQDQVHVTELVVAAVRQSPVMQELLYDLDIDKQKLANVIEWIRIRERLRRKFHDMQKTGSSRNKYGLDRAMTAVATPYLNSMSKDITMMARYGRLEPCVARDKEIDEIFRVIEGGRQSVLLVGDHGVGKMSIVHGIAERMIAEDVPDRLYDKRLVELSVSSLMAGTTTSGAQQRLIQLMSEVRRAKNIILVIENLDDLIGLSGEAAGGLDVSETLAEHLSAGEFFTIATTTTEGYNTAIINTQVGQVFARVSVAEMDENQAIRALESKAGVIEYKQKVFFSYDAIASAVEYAGRFLHDQQLPKSAVDIITEAASAVRAQRGEHTLVLGEDVAAIISDKTGIPTTSISDDESTKLLRLEEAMHERVVGQNEAVMLVANALRRARAEVRSTKRPIANFLFLGPTGVGKTELAKTIADVYFGGEDRMIRVDMSEYQDQSAIYRLIGQPGQKGSGMLTEAVRQQPFSLVLLDEMEKADPNILNLFLQVFDDGRLTDSVGRVIDFTNTIIIATSNAATAYVQQELQAGKDIKMIRETLIRGELQKYYKPEFLNRFDGIVLFRALERTEIKEIAALMLIRVAKNLEEERGVELVYEDGALEALADVGFDPEFGARPMRRAIQNNVENALAELVLSGGLKRRDRLVLGEGLKLRVER